MRSKLLWIPTIVLLLTLSSCFSTKKAITTKSEGKPPAFKKVMVVILENTDYSFALKQPFFSQLAKEGALFTNFQAEAHPSQPNYIAIVAGSTLGVTTDDNVNLNGSQLGDLLQAHGKSWKTYAEDYPGNCFLGARSGKYARKHVPFISFKEVQQKPAECSHIVNASQLDQDLRQNALPDFSLYIPNLNNDGHDTGAKYADRWLSQAFGPKLKDPAFMKGMLFIVTFDESAGYSEPNRIYTVFYGPNVIPGSTVDRLTNHYDMLRTIEDTLGLGTLGRKDSSATPIQGIWR